MKKWIVLLMAMALTGLIFWSCSDDSPTKPDDNNNAVLQDNGVIINYEEEFSNLDVTSIDLVSIGEKDTLIFNGSMPATLAAGKSFVATDTTGVTPVCLIRTVESVWIEDGKTYAVTTQCGLGDVFKEYEFSSTSEFDLAQMVLDSAFVKNIKKTTNAKSVTVTEKTKDGKSVFDINLQDVVISTVPLVTADIIMTLEDIDVELSARWKENDHFIETTAHIESSAEIIINCDTNISLSASIPLCPPVKQWHTFWIVTPAGVPLPIPYTVNIGLGLSVSGSAGAGFSVGGGVSTTLDISFTYDDGVWDNNSSKTFETINPTFEATHELSLSASVGPGISVLIADIVGPEISAGPFVEAQKEFNYTESKIYDRNYVGLQAGASLVFNILGIEGLSLSYSFPAWQIWKMLTYENITDILPNNPPVINSMTASATSVQQGGTSTLTCSASDADGDALTYIWAKTGGTLSSTTGTSTVWTAPTTVGTYTVTVTVSDGEASVNQSKTITVTEIPNNPPVINSLTATATSVQQGGTSTLSCSASDADGDALTYTWTKTGGTLSSTTGTSTVWTAPTTVGTYTVTVTVSDGEASVNQSKTINVYEATYIDITAPVAGAQWDLAMPYDITWDCNFTDAVRIVIMKGGDSLSTIDPSAYNDGVFTYTVTYTHTPGTDYQIKLVNTANWSINDTSDYFTILDTPNTAPTCTITLGTTGTAYTQGDTVQILTSAHDNDGTVDTLRVYRNDVLVNTMSESTYSNFYNWFTDGTVANGSYTFKVIAVDDDGAEGTSNEITVTLNDGTTPEGFVYVQGGTFTMGDHFSEGDSDELPLHSVTVSDFYMGATEVTQAEWSAYMPAENWSSYGTGDTYPAYYVSWYEIIKYCNLRSINEGLTPCYTISSSTDPADWGTVPTSSNSTWNAAICNWNANGYRLPSEAEWEYASRGGIHNADNYHYSGSDTIDDVAWYNSNSGSTSHPVGTKAANQLGLYDMSGNLWEWCWDWYGSYTSDAQTNPYGPTTGSYRVGRGGNWYNSAYYCRVANRYDDYPYSSVFNDGFRLSRTP